MSVGEFFIGYFAEIKRLLQVELPFFNLSIWRVLMGLFIVNLSVWIYRFFFREHFIYHPYHSYIGGKDYKRKGE